MQFLSEHGNEVNVRIERVTVREDANYAYNSEWVRISAGTGPYLDTRIVQTITLNDDKLIGQAVQLAIEGVLALYRDRVPVEIQTDLLPGD